MDNCFFSFVAFVSIVLAVAALVRSASTSADRRKLLRLEEELDRLKAKLAVMERQWRTAQREQTPTIALPEAETPSPAACPPALSPTESPSEPIANRPILTPVASVEATALDEPIPAPPAALPAPCDERTAAPGAASIPASAPAPTPARTCEAPARVPQAHPTPTAQTSSPSFSQIPSPSSASLRRAWNWEDLLGTQIFLKLGVAILVIGVVFAMGLVFQQMGPLGKVCMSYGGALGLLGLGLFAERRERYRTFGRALLAGAWGILYFVTYAAGFVDAARVFSSPAVSVSALILMASATVAFSLRYRNEWTTTSAFLLIFLSLGISAHETGAGFNLSAVAVVALAMAVLISRTGWLRLLGLGIPATWMTLVLGLSHSGWSRWEMEIGASMNPGTTAMTTAGVIALCAAVFQLALLAVRPIQQRRAWQGLGQIGNFAGALSLTLHLVPHAQAYIWMAAYGLAHLGAAVIYQRKQERGLYLLTATEGLAALALVTPLRLGLRHHLTPFMRLLGIEALLAGGVFLKERYFRMLAYAAFLLTALEILLFRVHPDGHPFASLLVAGTSVALLNALLLRTRWKRNLEDGAGNEAGIMASTFTSLAVLMGSVLVWGHAPEPWRGPLFAALALAWIGMGRAFDLKDLLAQGLIWGLQAMIALMGSIPGSATGHAAWLPTGLGALGLAAAYLALRQKNGRPLDPSWTHGMGGLLGVQSTMALCTLIIREFPGSARSPLLALLALAILGVGLSMKWKECVWIAALIDLAACACFSHQDPVSMFFKLSPLGCSLLATAVVLLLQEVLLRRRERDWPWETPAMEWFANPLDLYAAALVTVFIFMEIPPAGIAPSMVALAWVWLWAARVRANVFHSVTSALLTLAAALAIGTQSSGLHGTWHGIPIRLGSVCLAVALGYALQHLWHQVSVEDDSERPLLADHVRPKVLAAMAASVLVACAVCASATIKFEALAHGKNLLVALAWALLGVLHLERSRTVKTWAWKWMGHGFMAAALVHFIAVNLLQDGNLAGWSLRLITGLPFLAMLIYARLANEEESGPAWTSAYLYAIHLTVALLVLYDCHRAWVLPLWSLHALACLAWGLRRDANAWLRSALILMIASLARGLGHNLVMRDLQGGLALNRVTVPIAAILILSGYILLRLDRSTELNPDGDGHSFGRNRFPWFAAQAILLFGFIWVEASGTLLTVWLSVLGLGMVALGFLFKERVARLTGLGILSACILKLFFYDLRGLTGLSRVASFIALGLVLVLVSFVYTRFKERMEKFL